MPCWFYTHTVMATSSASDLTREQFSAKVSPQFLFSVWSLPPAPDSQTLLALCITQGANLRENQLMADRSDSQAPQRSLGPQ